VDVDREELALALEHAAIGVKVHSRKGRWLTPEPPPTLNPLMEVNAGGRVLRLNLKHIAALLGLRRSGGALPLSAVTEICGLSQRQSLGLALEMRRLGLVDVVGTSTRKAVTLTPLGWEISGIIEERFRSLGLNIG